MNAVLTTLRIFEEVALRQPIGVSELARTTGSPKSSVHRSLVTLQKAGWLRIVDTDRVLWGVTMKALALGLRSAGEQDFRETAAPVMARLAADTDETVHLGVRYDDELVIVAREDGNQIVRVVVEVGTRLPLPVTSGGVAIMALLDPAEVDDLVAGGPREFAGFPTPGAEDLRREIARSRDRGYAANISSSWYRSDVASVGAAVTGPAGRPIGAVVLSLPGSRFDETMAEPLARLVVSAAADITALVAAV